MNQQHEDKVYSFEDLLNEQGYFVFTNVGVSMMPLLRQRKDLIEIRKKNRAIKKYDVALYKRDGKYILHRCIEVTPAGYVFAGDHNTIKEYDVTDDMIIGLMSRVIRNGKDINLSSLSYRLYSFFWTNLFPVKVVLFKTIRILQRMSRITPSKIVNYINWKLVKVIDLIIDYHITGRDLSKRDIGSTNTQLGNRLTNYLAIHRILSNVKLSSVDKIMVIGCGKGREIAYLLLKHGSYHIYGIETNKFLLQSYDKWTKKYRNVHIACEDFYAIDFNLFSILYLNRSFTGQESYEFVRLLEQQMHHSITLIHPFDQSSKSIFENRPGWTLQNREEILKVYGLQVVNTPRRYSVWIFAPQFYKRNE